MSIGLIMAQSRMEQGLSSDFEEICQHPFILLAQSSYQILQVSGGLFMIALLETNRACSPRGPDHLSGKAVALGNCEGLLSGSQSVPVSSGTEFICSADEQYLAGAAGVSVLQAIGRPEELSDDLGGGRDPRPGKTHPNRMREYLRPQSRGCLSEKRAPICRGRPLLQRHAPLQRNKSDVSEPGDDYSSCCPELSRGTPARAHAPTRLAEI